MHVKEEASVQGATTERQPAVGEYQPVGWMQWPDHLDYSFQFMRALGAAQEGASLISECFLAGARIIPGDDESWYREWCRFGDVNRARADEAIAAGHVQTARMNWLRAANYYRSAEFFLDHDDVRRLQLLDKIEACSKEYLARLEPAGEVVKVPYGEQGDYMDAYFIRSPYAPEKAPVVICFGGLDEFKDELLHEMPKHALPRGLSLLLVDLPGQGATLRRRKLLARVDTEVPVAGCVDWLQARADVDPDRIALYGASFGAYFAPRAAAFEHRLKALAADGVSWDLHRTLIERGFTEDRIAVRHLKWVLGAETFAEVAEKTKPFRLADVQKYIRCPYLIVEGECDFVGFEYALESYEYSKRHGLDVTFKVFTAEDTGASHCQVDNPTLGQEYICDWLADQLGIDQTQLPGRLVPPSH